MYLEDVFRIGESLFSKVTLSFHFDGNVLGHIRYQ